MNSSYTDFLVNKLVREEEKAANLQQEVENLKREAEEKAKDVGEYQDFLTNRVKVLEDNNYKKLLRIQDQQKEINDLREQIVTLMEKQQPSELEAELSKVIRTEVNKMIKEDQKKKFREIKARMEQDRCGWGNF